MLAPKPAAAEARLCEDTLSHLSGSLGDVFLIGVAHVSNRSVELVEAALQQARPDLVMVELDSDRIKVKPETGVNNNSSGFAVQERQSWSPEPQANVLGVLAGLAQAALRKILEAFYIAAEKFLGAPAGLEMLTAMKGAVRAGVPVLLGDRPAKVTLARIVEEASSTDLPALEAELGRAAPELDMEVGTPSGVQGLLESYRDQATARRLREAFRRTAPGFFNALIGERDAYMADGLLEGLRAGRRRILAVVGSVHVQGISERLAELGSLRAVDTCVY